MTVYSSPIDYITDMSVYLSELPFVKLFLTHFRTKVYSIAPCIVVLAQLELGLCAVKS